MHVGAEAQLRPGSEDLPRPDDLIVSVGRGDGRNTRTGVYFWEKRDKAQEKTWV